MHDLNEEVTAFSRSRRFAPHQLGPMQPNRGLIGRQLAARFLGRIGEALIFSIYYQHLIWLISLAVGQPRLAGTGGFSSPHTIRLPANCRRVNISLRKPSEII